MKAAGPMRGWRDKARVSCLASRSQLRMGRVSRPGPSSLGQASGAGALQEGAAGLRRRGVRELRRLRALLPGPRLALWRGGTSAWLTGQPDFWGHHPCVWATGLGSTHT